MGNAVVGVLTWREGHRFQEPDYFRRLIRAGAEMGVSVFFFSYEDVRVRERKIRGFVPVPGGGWKSRLFPWPDVVIDRVRRRKKGYLPFRRRPLFLYANSTFANKWTVSWLLSGEEAVKRWIPAAHRYEPAVLRRMLARYPTVYVKPANGTGGRSILKVSRAADGYCLSGQNRQLAKVSDRVSTSAELVRWVTRWVHTQRIRNGTFMLQQGLELELIPGHVVDTRLLIQKDGEGAWSVTGLGIRMGDWDSAISNLHGGGRAVPFLPFMSERFGSERAQAIETECRELAHNTAVVLEKHFGRMLEFGLDIGVDTDGRVWLIEVNPKPGRDIFRQMGDLECYALAVRRPLEYALHLVNAQRRGKLAGERSG